MGNWQLDCGCWQQDRNCGADIGGVLTCLKHGNQVIIGYAGQRHD